MKFEQCSHGVWHPDRCRQCDTTAILVTEAMIEAGKDERMECFKTEGREANPVSVGEALTRIYRAMHAKSSASEMNAHLVQKERVEALERQLAEARDQLAKVDAELNKLNAPTEREWEGLLTKLSRRGRIGALVG